MRSRWAVNRSHPTVCRKPGSALRPLAKILFSACLLPGMGAVAFADSACTSNREPGAPEIMPECRAPTHGQWVERAQQQLHDAVSQSAMLVDRLFGAHQDERAYEQASGSLAPALLWDEFHGFQPRLRFRANMPLPGLNQRFGAFIGRVNRDEYVTERAEESGAFPRQYGPAADEQTLLGLAYRERPRQGGRFQAGAGVRLAAPFDPYVKASYVYERGVPERGLLSVRETGFWQNSEGLGVTSRVDIGRIGGAGWFLRWTGSGTLSQESAGLRGYSTLMALRELPSRRAVALAIGLNGESNAPVPLHDYGAKIAYRQRVLHEGLVLELRSSLTWPKDAPGERRRAAVGVGIGFEMFFGTEDVLARPVTF